VTASPTKAAPPRATSSPAGVAPPFPAIALPQPGENGKLAVTILRGPLPLPGGDMASAGETVLAPYDLAMNWLRAGAATEPAASMASDEARPAVSDTSAGSASESPAAEPPTASATGETIAAAPCSEEG
jgi:hypothetical protein